MTEPESNAQTPDQLASAVRAARHGDELAFRTLYETIQPGLLRYLHLLVGADAPDVASETWLQVVRDLRTFKGDGKGFRRWTVAIARHRALDHLRHQQRRPSIPTPIDALTEVPANNDTAELAIEALSTDAALDLIASLPKDQAEAVMLRVVVGLDAESAAKILGKRSGAVRTAAYRGLRRLHEALGEGDDMAHDTTSDTKRGG